MIIMKSILLISVLVALVACASAHSLYAEFPEKPALGSEAKVWIAYGHGGTAESDLSGLPVAKLVSPEGKVSDLALESYKSGLIGEVSLSEKGCYILDLQAESTLFDPSWYGSSGGKNLVEKYGRVLMPVESGKGCDWSSGKGLEIIPKVDPYGLKSGDSFKAGVLWNGRPLPGSYSAVVSRSPQDVLVVQHAQETETEGSSDDGTVDFQLTRPGLWVLSYEATVEEKGIWKAAADDSQGHWKAGDGMEYDQIAPTAYLTFWVEK